MAPSRQPPAVRPIPGGPVPEIRPFRALRYDPSTVPDPALVVAPPYDVIGPDEHERLLARHPANIVRLDLPRDEIGDEPDDRYRRAARTLAAWRSDGTLHKDPHPSIYVYEQAYRVPGTDVERTQRGFFARLRLEPFGPGSRRPAPRADDVRRQGGPLQAPARDRCQHEPGRRAVRRPERRRAGVLDRLTARAARHRRRGRRRHAPSTLGGSRRRRRRRRGRAAAWLRGVARSRSRSPTATIATRRRCAIATSAGCRVRARRTRRSTTS